MLATTLALVLAMSTPQVTDLLPDTTAFWETGSYPFRAGTAVVLDTTGDLAFVGAGDGVFVVDVSNPSQPVVLSDRIRCGAMVKDMFLDGTRLYLALLSFSTEPDRPRDVEVWDVSIPAAPLRLGGIDLYFGAQCVYVRGDTLLIGSLRSLFTYDISDLEHPVRLESLPDLCSPELIRVRDTLAFVSGSANGVLVYDVHSLAHPVLLAQWGAIGSFPGLELVGDRLYYASSFGALGTASGLRIYDISNPLQGQLLGAFDTTGENGAYRVAVVDTIALVTWRFDYTGAPTALRVVSVAEPSTPRLLSIYGGKCLGVAVRDTLALVAFATRFEVMNVADPSRPTRVGSVPLGLAGTQLACARGMVYSVGGSFAVLDAHSSRDIELTGALDMGGTAWLLSQDDSLALVAVLDSIGSSTAAVISVASPHRPEILSSLPGIRIARSLLLIGSAAYVASESGLAVFSLSDPRNPVLVGNLPRSVDGSRLLLRDTLLLASDRGHLLAIDVSDPTTPDVVQDTGIDLDDFALKDSFLYVVTGTSPGGFVFSIGDPQHLRLLTTFLPGVNLPGAISVGDTLLAIAGGVSDIAVHSVAVPDSPVHLGYLRLADGVAGITVVGDTLYTSAVTRYRLVRTPSGIELEPVGGVEVRPLHVWPNVVNRELNLAGCKTAILVDASGRKVLDLKAGANDIRHVQPGVYFVREAQAQTQAQAVRKVVVTK